MEATPRDAAESKLEAIITAKVSTVLELTHLGRTKLYELIDNGTIVARKDGPTTVIEMWSLRAYLRSLPLVQPRKKVA